MNNKALISLAITAYNEESVLEKLYERLVATLAGVDFPFEIVIVDNGSSDRTLEILKGLHEQDPRLKYVSLSRNFGHQGGLVAAMEHCTGDAIISMDADLQHPPELIPELIARWQEGNRIVYTIKNEQKLSWPRATFNRAYYFSLSRLSGFDLGGGQSDFRLVDRHALDILLALNEKNKFLRGLVKWIGFPQCAVSYDVAERYRGTSKFSTIDLWRFALDGLLSFSAIPIHVFSMIGLIASALSLLYFGFVMAVWIGVSFFGVNQNILPLGWSSLAAGVFFIGGVQLIGIGLLGEYLARIFDEVKNRPTYLVQEKASGLKTEKSATVGGPGSSEG